MNKEIMNNLEAQMEIGEKMNNGNGALLARISCMCTWMVDNGSGFMIKPMVGEGARRRNMLMIEFHERRM